MDDGAIDIRQRQRPLRRCYRQTPDRAWVRDRACTVAGPKADPVHGFLVLGDTANGPWPYGVHGALGGDHDAPNPGDLLCGALAACQDSTLRMIADRIGLALADVHVEVTAEVDVRGTLAMERTVPVGFQRMLCQIHLRVPEGTDPGWVEQLCFAAERSCIVLQTLRYAIDVRVQFDVGA